MSCWGKSLLRGTIMHIATVEPQMRGILTGLEHQKSSMRFRSKYGHYFNEVLVDYITVLVLIDTHPTDQLFANF